MVELRQLGGTLRDRPPGCGGARLARRVLRVSYSVGVPMGPGAAEAIESRIDTIKGALAPWSRGKTYLNFAEKNVTIGDAVGAEAFTRLEQVRRQSIRTDASAPGTRSRRRRPRRAARQSRRKPALRSENEGVSREKVRHPPPSGRQDRAAATIPEGIVFVSYEHDGPAGG